MARCAPCARTVARLRALKSSLLGLRNPSLDPEFQRRLLTPDHATYVNRADHRPRAARHRPYPAPDRRPGSTRLPHALPLVVAGTATAAALVLTSAYVLGAPPQPATADGAGAGTGTVRAGWNSAVPQTPALLDEQQLDLLRAGGWHCPELASLGFVLRSAEGITVAGRPTLELVLENGSDTVTVYEQRRSGARGTAAPSNAVTGNTVTKDGFEQVGGTDRQVWVRSGDPWQVVLDSPSVTYTVVSDLPAAQMPRTLSRLVTTERAQLSFSQPEEADSVVDRILRGLTVLTSPRDAG